MQALQNILLLVLGVVHLTKASVDWRQEAKKAALRAGETEWGRSNHGFVLVPATRHKRSISEEPTKYKRLSHSVHVQTDIRYR